MVGTKVDITERKRAEEAIRESEAVLQASHREIQDLAGRLIASQEVERARIARDLHDDLSQQLAGLSIALSGVKRRVGRVAGRRRSAERRVVAPAARGRARREHPAPLARPASQRARARRPGRRPGRALRGARSASSALAVTFSAEGDFESTAADAALCLYRVAQEASAQRRHARRRPAAPRSGWSAPATSPS